MHKIIATCSIVIIAALVGHYGTKFLLARAPDDIIAPRGQCLFTLVLNQDCSGGCPNAVEDILEIDGVGYAVNCCYTNGLLTDICFLDVPPPWQQGMTLLLSIGFLDYGGVFDGDGNFCVRILRSNPNAG